MFEELKRRNCRILGDVLFGKSKSGWMDMYMAKASLNNQFRPGFSTERKANGEYQLLLFNGYNSHVNM
jgi:hypothetical protein